MITLYELKNKSFCRCFIRTPFYIKNLFLLATLAFALTVIYLIYFSTEGSGNLRVRYISKLLKGLNSDTFNYLAGHSDSLKLTQLLNNYQMQLSSNQFVDDCLRISKPCKFEALAKTWPGFDNWKYNSGEGELPYAGLEGTVGAATLVDVYVDLDPDAQFENAPNNSFTGTTLTKMKYSEFLA
jgi:hypothetical protein